MLKVDWMIDLGAKRYINQNTKVSFHIRVYV